MIVVDNVHKAYGKHQVLTGCTFSINEPKIVALVGPNGSGKSTLLNVITNLLKADQGRITLVNKPNTDPEIFREISFLKDNTVLYPYLSGYDHLRAIQSIQKLDKQRIEDVANKIGITEYMHKKVSTYSLGMKQHLLIAMAIMNQPKLILMDEPLTGLDPTSIIEVRELLKELLAKGTTILLSSHTLSEIDLITNHILFLKEGKIIEEDLREFEKTAYIIEVKDVNALDEVVRQSNKLSITNNQIHYVDAQPNIQAVLQMLNEHQVEILNISQQKVGAEQRYKAIFKTEMGI